MYECLTTKNLIYTIEEERYIRDKFGVKKLLDSSYQKCLAEYEQRMNGKEMVEGKILYGVPSYQF